MTWYYEQIKEDREDKVRADIELDRYLKKESEVKENEHDRPNK